MRECYSLSASIKFQIVGLVQLKILLKPLCHPSDRLEDLGSPQMVASHWFHPSLSKSGSEKDVPSHVYSRVPEEEGAAVISGEVRGLKIFLEA